jgi:hypothetical protein
MMLSILGVEARPVLLPASASGQTAARELWSGNESIFLQSRSRTAAACADPLSSNCATAAAWVASSAPRQSRGTGRETAGSRRERTSASRRWLLGRLRLISGSVGRFQVETSFPVTVSSTVGAMTFGSFANVLNCDLSPRLAFPQLHGHESLQWNGCEIYPPRPVVGTLALHKLSYQPGAQFFGPQRDQRTSRLGSGNSPIVMRTASLLG